MIIDRFVCVHADTDAARGINFNLRYKVFCEETGFEDCGRFPDEQESDDFDRYATHFLVWDRAKACWVGGMRLVDASLTPLPSETICAPQVLPDIDQVRSRAVEFSRFCILSEYRRTPSSMSFGMHTPEESPQSGPIPVFFRQEDNEIFLRLIRANIGWGQVHGRDIGYCLVNPALGRVMMHLGIPLKVAGCAVEHRGTRIPYRYDISEAERGLSAAVPAFDRLVRTSPAYVKYSDFFAGRAATIGEWTQVLPVEHRTQRRDHGVFALNFGGEACSRPYLKMKTATGAAPAFHATVPASMPLNARGGGDEGRVRRYA